MHRFSRRLVASLSAAALVAGLLTACGGDDGSTASGTETGTAAAAKKTKITIGVVPISPTAPIPLGIEQGFFEEEGLDVELNTKIAVPAISGAVVSGSLTAGWSGWGGVAAYATKGLPIKVAVTLTTSGDSPENDDLAMLTLADSGIASAKELKGKSVALATVGGDSEAVMRAIARKAGVDPKAVKIEVMDYSTMPAALRAGRVAAAMMTEPAITSLKAEEEVRILGSSSTLQPNRPGSNIIVSKALTEKDPELVARIQRAVAKSVEYAQQNPDAVRKVLQTAYDTPKPLAEKMALPNFVPWPPLEDIQGVADTLHDAGLLSKEVDMSTLRLPPPSGA